MKAKECYTITYLRKFKKESSNEQGARDKEKNQVIKIITRKGNTGGTNNFMLVMKTLRMSHLKLTSSSCHLTKQQ